MNRADEKVQQAYRNSRDGIVVLPVSYTHLDVYKRQDAIRLEEATAMGMCCASSHVRISSSPGFLGGGA